MRLGTHLGRISLGLAVAGTLAAVSTAPVLAARPNHNASAATCALSATGVGSSLTLNGNGYAAGASYRVEFVWPNGAGVADTAAWADGSGHITVSTDAYWSGTYQASVYATSGNQALVASCSTSVS